MAEEVATRSIHGSFLNQGSGSVHERAAKLKPASFASKVLPRDEKRNKGVVIRRNYRITAKRAVRFEHEVIPVSPEDVPKREVQYEQLRGIQQLGDTSVAMWSKPIVRHHASHQKVIDLVKEYNAQSKDNTIAIMLDTKASFSQFHYVLLYEAMFWLLEVPRGGETPDCVSVNYDDFVNDVEVGDMLLVDGGMMSLVVKSKTEDSVKCEIVDGGKLKSRRHLNLRGKSATLPSITGWRNGLSTSFDLLQKKDWDDIKFAVDNKVDFYVVSFVKDAQVVHDLKNDLRSCDADIHVIVKIESADSIPNLHSIITASDGVIT
ncbi:Plastidial pyruvate kinase 2 [Hibiscus syriacus]|uniref:Pyruvate kinase n=1 Tax=Hibiscus syriacus TaxID=106335 RepID=A0A6A2WSB7_HIBSY|nr:Plastidial pyruvate kinase 2 [Hibiscus syriacus]